MTKAGTTKADTTRAGTTRTTVRAAVGPALTARLDQAVEGVRREAGIPGVADTVTRRPMTPGLFMRIGSETKTCTATALAGRPRGHGGRHTGPLRPPRAPR
ncbi:hypothetical protein [Streptomyces sp. MB09-02B]|uniref:hypothetical protein n=1 Tax=Streptomyces sp. MB09-02B TaxID=3028667 RepID=UPI0029B5589C|nr:hypothetical protein [Streptomyces sp. MB09-02B]MDX3642901.1 hypothetical protein [Streptomyces sp. MB09-02B]